MTGIICMWSGAIVDIPDGWLLCDGTNGTPDLTDKFIVGAGDTHNPGDQGGQVAHDHNVWFNSENGGGAHKHLSDGDTGGPGASIFNHSVVAGNKELYGSHTHSYVDWTSVPDVEHNHELDGDTEDNFHIPPYYALAFIMKT